jgi:hypothetical protein
MNDNVFRTCMIATVVSQRDSGLVVTEKGCWLCQWSEHLSNKASKPKSFFCGMHSRNIFGFRSGKSDEFLLLQTPKNRPSVDKEGKASDGSSMLLSGTIRVGVPHKTLNLCSESQRE